MALGLAAILAVRGWMAWTQPADTVERVEKLQRQLEFAAANAAGQGDEAEGGGGDDSLAGGGRGGGQGGGGWPGGSRSPAGSDDASEGGGGSGGEAGAADPLAAAVTRVQARRLFTPAPPDAFRNVRGILGNRVLYPGGQSFGLGDQAMDARIVAIGTNWVEFSKDGQTVTLDIFQNVPRGPERQRVDPDATPDANLSADNPSQERRGRRGEGRRNRGEGRGGDGNRGDWGGQGNRGDY